jgi:hypothetical protein
MLESKPYACGTFDALYFGAVEKGRCPLGKVAFLGGVNEKYIGFQGDNLL